MLVTTGIQLAGNPHICSEIVHIIVKHMKSLQRLFIGTKYRYQGNTNISEQEGLTLCHGLPRLTWLSASTIVCSFRAEHNRQKGRSQDEGTVTSGNSLGGMIPKAYQSLIMESTRKFGALVFGGTGAVGRVRLLRDLGTCQGTGSQQPMGKNCLRRTS